MGVSTKLYIDYYYKIFNAIIMIIISIMTDETLVNFELNCNESKNQKKCVLSSAVSAVKG